MVVSTRNSNPSTSNGTPLILDDETKRFLAETIAGMMENSLADIQRSMANMANDITALRWVFRCEQFFLLEQTLDLDKVTLISIHLYDKALLWHSQFVRTHGTNVTWEVYKKAILARFGNVYEDPMSELKNLKYETTAREYEDAFESLLSRVEISEDHAISLFMGGLPTEIEMGVRMFKPQTLADAYYLANLQETTLNAVKKKGRNAFVPNQSRYSNGSNSTYQKPLLATPTSSTNNATVKPNTPVTTPNRRLSQKEYAEKRANNLCFFYDQKYVPRHKCSGQLYSLVLVPEIESEGDF
ncbi:putative mitochondrial protein [Tanacetum coccineum]